MKEYKLEPSTKRYLEKQERKERHQREAFTKVSKSSKEIERGERKLGKAISSIKLVPHPPKSSGSSFLLRYSKQSGYK